MADLKATGAHVSGAAPGTRDQRKAMKVAAVLGLRDRKERDRRLESANASPKAQGERLAAARASANYRTGTEAARALNLTVSSYLAHENGNRAIRLDLLVLYAKKFGVNVHWLMCGEGEMRPAAGAPRESAAEPAPAAEPPERRSPDAVGLRNPASVARDESFDALIEREKIRFRPPQPPTGEDIGPPVALPPLARTFGCVFELASPEVMADRMKIILPPGGEREARPTFSVANFLQLPRGAFAQQPYLVAVRVLDNPWFAEARPAYTLVDPTEGVAESPGFYVGFSSSRKRFLWFVASFGPDGRLRLFRNPWSEAEDRPAAQESLVGRAVGRLQIERFVEADVEKALLRRGHHEKVSILA